jgi:hypothetical protein
MKSTNKNRIIINVIIKEGKITKIINSTFTNCLLNFEEDDEININKNKTTFK